MRFIMLSFSILVTISIITICSFNYPATIAQYNYLKSDSSSLVKYNDTSNLLNFKYPSFWRVVELPEIDAVLIKSPIQTVGIILETKDQLNTTMDETIMENIAKIKKELPNSQILTSSINQSDGSFSYNIEYAYGNNTDEFKIFQTLTQRGDNLYNFIYYSEQNLFDSFLDIARSVYNSSLNPIDTQNKTIKSSNHIINGPSNQFGSNEENKNELLIDNTTDHDQKSIRPQSNTIFYNNSDIGIKMQYPSNLIKVENERGVSLSTKNNSNGVVLVRTPTQGISEEQFALRQLSSLNETLTDFNVINSSITDLLGYPTQMVYFEYKNGSDLYRAMQFWKVSSENSYIVTYFGESAKMFDGFLPIASRILGTLVINPL